MINTVKIQGDGYLVNGTMSVPGNAPGNRHYKMVQEWIADGNEVLPEFTQEEIDVKALTEAKQAKLEALDNLTVTTTAGNVFDANDEARSNMNDAIQASSTLGVTEHQWKLADNSIVTISLDELKEAHALGIQAKGAIILGA